MINLLIFVWGAEIRVKKLIATHDFPDVRPDIQPDIWLDIWLDIWRHSYPAGYKARYLAGYPAGNLAEKATLAKIEIRRFFELFLNVSNGV